MAVDCETCGSYSGTCKLVLIVARRASRKPSVTLAVDIISRFRSLIAIGATERLCCINCGRLASGAAAAIYLITSVFASTFTRTPLTKLTKNPHSVRCDLARSACRMPSVIGWFFMSRASGEEISQTTRTAGCNSSLAIFNRRRVLRADRHRQPPR